MAPGHCANLGEYSNTRKQMGLGANQDPLGGKELGDNSGPGARRTEWRDADTAPPPKTPVPAGKRLTAPGHCANLGEYSNTRKQMGLGVNQDH